MCLFKQICVEIEFKFKYFFIKVISCTANWIGTSSAKNFEQQCSKQINQAYNTFPSGTICTFTCQKKYYQHGGKTTITCLDSGNWDEEVLDCRG